MLIQLLTVLTGRAQGSATRWLVLAGQVRAAVSKASSLRWAWSISPTAPRFSISRSYRSTIYVAR